MNTTGQVRWHEVLQGYDMYVDRECMAFFRTGPAVRLYQKDVYFIWQREQPGVVGWKGYHLEGFDAMPDEDKKKLVETVWRLTR